MLRRLASQARDLATWPLRLAYEVVELPTTLRNIRVASHKVGPAIDQVNQFAGRADEMVTEMDHTLADIGGLAKTLGAVNDQWRKTMGRMPIVGRVAAEIERTAAQLAPPASSATDDAD